MKDLIDAARAALVKILRFALLDPPHIATLANIATAANEGVEALAAAEARPATASPHLRAMAAAVLKQLGEPFPREEIDLDAVGLLCRVFVGGFTTGAAAETQPVACSGCYGCKCPKHYTAPPAQPDLSAIHPTDRIFGLAEEAQPVGEPVGHAHVYSDTNSFNDADEVMRVRVVFTDPNWQYKQRDGATVALYTAPPAQPVGEPVAPSVDLPERVVDWIGRSAGVAMGERCLYRFAEGIKDEVIARLPMHCFLPAAPPAQPAAPALAPAEPVAWTDEQAYHMGRGAYECSVFPANHGREVKCFWQLTSIQQAGWVAKAAMLAAAPAAPAQAPLTNAARDMLTERRRQIEAEGFDSTHDDEHDNGSMAAAGSAYALAAADALHPLSQGDGDFVHSPPLMWPWDAEWWKPGDPRRMLVKGSALMLAEIERLDRAAGITGEDT